jgi:hypothetical protein
VFLSGFCEAHQLSSNTRLKAKRFGNFVRGDPGVTYAQANTEMVVCSRREFVDRVHERTALTPTRLF